MFCFPTTRWLCNPLLLTSLFLSLSFTAATSLAQIGKLREDAPNALSSQASFTKSLRVARNPAWLKASPSSHRYYALASQQLAVLLPEQSFSSAHDCVGK